MTSVEDHQQTPTTAELDASRVVELRQYTLHPGMRDVLIELFDGELIEAQEAHGMHVIGQFRDLDDPNRFVWLRGFPDMDSRARALKAFYGGPVWREHRNAANATMLDSDNVLLLRAANPGFGFSLGRAARAPRGTTVNAHGIVITTTYTLLDPVDDWCAAYFDSQLKPRLMDIDLAVLACYITDPTPNTAPAFPVREGANVVVVLVGVDDADSIPLRQVDHMLTVGLGDIPGLRAPAQQLRLVPTARSRLTASSPACPALSSARRSRDWV